MQFHFVHGCLRLYFIASCSSAVLISSQETQLTNNPAYTPVHSLAAEEFPSSDMAGTDTYEFVNQSSAPANNTDNPSYQQHHIENEYTYPEVIPTPGQNVHMASDSDNVYEPTSQSNDFWVCADKMKLC